MLRDLTDLAGLGITFIISGADFEGWNDDMASFSGTIRVREDKEGWNDVSWIGTEGVEVEMESVERDDDEEKILLKLDVKEFRTRLLVDFVSLASFGFDGELSVELN